MTPADPQTDAEREQAECFVVVSRVPGSMFRPSGWTLGSVARDEMLTNLAAVEPTREHRAISLESGEIADALPDPLGAA